MYIYIYIYNITMHVCMHVYNACVCKIYRLYLDDIISLILLLSIYTARFMKLDDDSSGDLSKW